MAITGNGTATAPYVVHDYWELKNVCNTSDYLGNTDSVKYIRLDNDINCNDRAYGDDFEWETINLYGYVRIGSGNSAGVFNLNLDGHAIKNVMVKHNNNLFYGYNYGGSKIHNGQIRNIFGSSAKTIISDVLLEDISISANLIGFTNVCFSSCQFNRCSTYAESAKLNKHFIQYNGSSSFVNSDFCFKIDDANGKGIIYNVSSVSTTQVQSCRFRGEIHGEIGEGIRDTADCVCDVECDENQRVLTPLVNEHKNTLYNSDKMQLSITTGVIAAASTEMKNADTLTGKGFTVVDIKQSASD